MVFFPAFVTTSGWLTHTPADASTAPIQGALLLEYGAPSFGLLVKSSFPRLFFKIVKVKAHISKSSCRTPEEIYRRVGNNLADMFAKQGAARHSINKLLLDKLHRHQVFLFDISGLMARALAWRWRQYKDTLKSAAPMVGSMSASGRFVAPQFLGGSIFSHRMVLDEALR